MPGLVLTPVAPVLVEKVPTFHGIVDIPRYPPCPEGEALRNAWLAMGLRASQAAARLGITIVQAAQLKDGQWSCDWALANRLLQNP